MSGKSTTLRRCAVTGTGLFGPFDAEGGPNPVPPDALAFEHPGLRHADRITRFCLRGASDALLRAGVKPDDPARDAGGVFLGNALGAFEADLEHQRRLTAGTASPAVFANTLANVAAGWIAILEGLKGPMTTFASGLLSFADAVLAAHRTLSTGPGRFLLAGSGYVRQDDVRRTLHRFRGGPVPPAKEAASFLVLEPATGRPGEILLDGGAAARAAGIADPLPIVVERALEDLPRPDAVLVAGDAGRDRETALRLEGVVETPAILLSDIAGDLGEAAPALGAVLATRWLGGDWAPEPPSPPPRAVLVAGLDPCARRAFALRFGRR